MDYYNLYDEQNKYYSAYNIKNYKNRAKYIGPITATIQATDGNNTTYNKPHYEAYHG